MNAAQALETAAGFLKKSRVQQWELFLVASEQSGVELYKRVVKSQELTTTQRLYLRVFSLQRPGYAYTENFSKESIHDMVESALANSELADKLALKLAEPQTAISAELELYDPSLEQLEFKTMIEFCREMEDLSYGLDQRIINVPYLYCAKSKDEVFFQNSLGHAYNYVRGAVYGGLGVLAAEEKSRKLGYYSTGARRFEFDASQIVQEAGRRALGLLGARSIPSGKYPVLLRSHVAQELLAIYASVFFADMVQKGKSRLKGKLGENIASPLFSLYSDPHLPGEPGSLPFDGEGVATQRIAVVEKGVLLSFLYHLESAMKENVSPTGNATRGANGRIATTFMNFVVPLGPHSLSELQQAYPRLVQIEKLEGSASCSAVSGEISIGAQGFLLENGQIMHPVDQITLSGNFFDVLYAIEGISQHYDNSFSSFKVPDLLINGFFLAA